MKVALMPSAYAPAVGGVEELTARLARRLLDAGDDVEVWTIRHPAYLPEDEHIEGVRVRRFVLPMPRASARALALAPFELRTASRTLLAAALNLRPDVLHVQCFSANGAYAAWLARRVGVPLVVTLQGETVMDDTDIYERSLTLRTTLRRALGRAAAVTGCSRFVLEDAEQRFGLQPGRGIVIPNGVDLDFTTPAASVAVPCARFVFALGRVVEKKGFDLLLDAFAQIAPTHPDVGLVIGGTGSALDGLVRRAAAAGLSERVAFPGLLSRAQVTSAMATAEAFVLPSRVEPFGIVVLEALAAGCPAVVSARGGAPEIIRDGVDGLIVDPLDVGALAGAVVRVLDDTRLRQELRRAGPLRAAEFEWGAISSRYREIYERVAASRSALTAGTTRFRTRIRG
jgi:glycosyltransferase involved in cell wall biosynthesis